MFGPAGHLYIYLSYGLHACLNVVTGPRGQAGAVLIRALAPELGVARMRRRRGTVPERRIARGPGCVGQAMGLSPCEDGMDLVNGRVWISDCRPRRESRRVARGPRVGISREIARRWRFFLAGHPAVSGPGCGRAAGPAAKTSGRR
jgi:DNA-3-methyladenine glycosylase